MMPIIDPAEDYVPADPPAYMDSRNTLKILSGLEFSEQPKAGPDPDQRDILSEPCVSESR